MEFKNIILYLMTALFFVAMAGTDIYIPSLPTIAKEFNTTPHIVNLTLSAYNGSIAIFVLFAAMFSNRFGRRKIMIFAPLCFAVSSILISLSFSIWEIIILRCFQAIGSAFIFIVARQILKDIMNSREQLHANAIMLLGFVLSPALAPIIGAHLADNFGWRSNFTALGISGAILGILVIKFLPETNNEKSKSLPNPIIFLKENLELLKDKFFIFITFIFVSANGAFYGFIAISSYVYINDYKVSPIFYSYIYVLMALSYFIGNRYTTHLNEKMQPYEKILKLGTGLTFIGAILLIFCKAFEQYHQVLFIITFAGSLMRCAGAMINPTTQTIIINHFNKLGGVALGLSMSIMWLGSSIAISFVSFFHTNPVLGLGLVSVIYSTFGLLSFVLVKKNLN